MKSRSNHTAPSGRRLLIVNSIVILLLVNSIALVQSADPKNPIELSSWIDVSPNNWPGADGTDKSEFLVYHSEYVTNSTLFGLNKKLSDDIDLAAIERPELSFRYWSSSDGSLRARSPSGPVRRDVKLGKTSSWKDSTTEPASAKTVRTDLKKISKEDWSNFAFISQDVFTLALKDVKVKYVQKVDLDKIETLEITAYNATNNFVNFKDPAAVKTPAAPVVPVVPAANPATGPGGSVPFTGPEPKLDNNGNLALEAGTSTFKITQSPKVIILRAQIDTGAVEDVILTAAANGATPKIDPAKYAPYFSDTKSGAQVFTQLNVKVATGKLTISKITSSNSVLNGEDFLNNNLIKNVDVNADSKLVIKPGTYTFKLAKEVPTIVLNVQLDGGGAEDVKITAKANAAPDVDKQNYKNVFESTPSGTTALLKDLKVKVATGLTIIKITLGADKSEPKDFVKTLQSNTVAANQIVTFKAGPLSTFNVPAHVKTIALKAKIDNAAAEDVTLTAGANGAAPKTEPAKYEPYFKDTKSGAQVFTLLDVKVATGELAISRLIFDPIDVTVANFLATLDRQPAPTHTADKLPLSTGTYTIDVTDKSATKITFKWGTKSVELGVGAGDTFKSNDDANFKTIFGGSTIVSGKITVLKIVAAADSSISEFKINAETTAVGIAELTQKLKKETPPSTPSTPGTNTYEYQAPNEPTKDLVKGLVQLSEKNPTDKTKDVCYTITKVGSNAPIIDVYLTLKAATVGIKLNTIKSGDPSLEVCLFKYVALQNIGDYMISLVAEGDVQNGFKITVETKAEDIQKKSDIVAPSGAVKPETWLLYNPHFDYSINAPTTSEFLICDIVANCYPYELDQNEFKISSKIQAELVSSPFVRIQTSSAGTFVSSDETKFYENSRKQFRAKFDVDNAKALKPNPTETKETPTKFTVTYEVAFDTASNEATITVPFDLVDLRVQQLVVTLSLDKTIHDDINAKKTKSPLTLTKVNLKKGTDQDFDLQLSLGGDDKVELKSGFTIGSDEIFFSELAQVLTGTSATFVLQWDSSVYKTAKVSLKIDILKSARKTVEGKGQAAKFTNTFTSVPKAEKANTKQVALEPKSNALLATSWIQSSDAGSNAAVDTSFKIEVVNLADKTKLTDASKIEIFRVVVDQNGNPKVSDKLAGDFKDNVITFTKTDANVVVKGTFRVAYLIHSNEELQLKITVDKLEVTGAVGAKDSENCKKEATKLFADCQYETLNCASSFAETDGKACHLSKLNRLAEIKCDMSNGCANIFDHKLPVSKKYITDETEYVPFQIDANTKYQNLLYKRPEDNLKGEFCISFTYTALESTLTVSTDPNGFGVVFPTTPYASTSLDRKVCASWLTEDVDAVYGLYFSFDKAPLYNVDGHNLEILGFLPDINAKVTIDEGIYINNLDPTQFLVQNDADKWGVEKKDLSNKLTFSISEEDLNVLSANAQADKYTALYTSTLQTKWIKVPNTGGHLSIGFAYDTGNSEFTDYKVHLSVNSPAAQVWHGDVSDIKAGEQFVVKDTSFGNFYQFEISVELNQSKIIALKQTSKDPNLASLNTIAGDLTLTFENFTINDPCVSAQNVLETCTAVGQGDCVRSYKEANYSHECKCKTNYKGDHCELTDYCTRDKAKNLCKKDKKCENDNLYQQVKCDCDADEVWSAFLLKCINTKALNCGANEVLGSDQKCTCADGFVPIEKACVPFNPCEEPHRKAYNTKTRNYISPKACNAETKCERIGTGTKPTDFTCKCEKGVNDHLIMTPDAKCLPDACSSCGNKGCIQSGKDGKCTDAECTAEGFQLQQDPKDKDKKTCIFNPKSSSLISKFHCPGEVELKEDQKPGCKCGDQLFDSKTRGCLDQCSSEVLKQCTTQGAPSCEWIGADKKAQCVCKDGDLPVATNQTDPESWKCISQCAVSSLPDFQNLKCSDSFEHCEVDAKFDFKSKLTATKDAKLIKGVLVKDTKFPSTVTKLDVCKCDEGFELYKDISRCIPYETPTHYIKGMEFDLHLNGVETLKAYLERAAASFQKLIEDILLKENIKPSNAKCEKQTETTISCSIDFQSDADDKIISTKLNDACIKVSDTKCVYLQKPSKQGRRRRQAVSNGAGGAATFDPMFHELNQKVQSGVIEHCAKKDTCSKYQYSTCKTTKNSQFECLCEDKTFFEVADKLYIPSRTTNLEMQICRVKNLCGVDKSGFGCTDSAAKCHFSVEHDDAKNEYTPASYCTCPGTNLTLAHQTLTCKQTCNAQCGNSVTCAQDYYTNAVSCNCKEGYSGATCGTKVESETTSKAYLISTIVVSIIAVIALIGLAVLYFRRNFQLLKSSSSSWF